MWGERLRSRLSLSLTPKSKSPPFDYAQGRPSGKSGHKWGTQDHKSGRLVVGYGSLVSHRKEFFDAMEDTVHLKQLGKIAAVLFISCSAIGTPADDQRTVANLDKQYQAAVKVNDAATMDRILADDFLLVVGDGSVSTKADLLKEARSRRVIYEHQDESEQTVRVWGDTAVVTAKLWGKGTDNGKPFDWTLWFSDTYVRTPSGWRYVFGQASLPLR
jgi:ketosteroid isomerase-like protein